MRTPWTLASVALMLLALAACETGTAPNTNIAGIYELTSFDGETLPIVFFEDADLRAVLVGGTLEMTGDGRYREPIVYHFIDKNTGATDVDTGTDTGSYRLIGTTITFQSDDPGVGSYTGTYSGDVIRYTIGTVDLTFSRAD